MHPNAQRIEQFYTALAARDPTTMSACYAPEVVFSDPAFPQLTGERASAMWHMLCERGRDLSLVYENVSADERSGQARWTARYTFSKTGRPVVNVVDARFEFRDGRIVRHQDDFDFWRWSRQALGAPGLLLGWSKLLQKKVQDEAARALTAYIAERG